MHNPSLPDTSVTASSSPQVAHLFAHPVMHHDWPDSGELNHALKSVILERRNTAAGVVKTNRGGWQSEADLQDWDSPAVEQLVARIEDLLKPYVAQLIGRVDPEFDSGWKIRAWANVNGKGHFNRSHNHLGTYSQISGIYYVDVGDIESDPHAMGRTVFEDRTHVAIDVNHTPDPLRRDFRMNPQNGRMVLFPASLMHSVEPYQGERPRITIAFNLFHPGLGIPRMAEYMQSVDWRWANFRGVMIMRRKVPEKLYGLALIPQQLLARRPGLSLRALLDHLVTAKDHAFALASERFEPNRNAK